MLCAWQARIEHLFDKAKDEKLPFFTHYGDVTDINNLVMILNKVQPDEFYNLAAQSHVHTSFELPIYTAQVDGVGTMNALEAVRQSGLAGKTRFYQVIYFLLSSISMRMTSRFVTSPVCTNRP